MNFCGRQKFEAARTGSLCFACGYEALDGVVFDLGVSSMQLDRTERGFSYAADAPLDMRMDPTSSLTAAEILNTYDESALTDILRRYGEEKLARRIASHIAQKSAARCGSDGKSAAPAGHPPGQGRG